LNCAFYLVSAFHSFHCCALLKAAAAQAIALLCRHTWVRAALALALMRALSLAGVLRAIQKAATNQRRADNDILFRFPNGFMCIALEWGVDTLVVVAVVAS